MPNDSKPTIILVHGALTDASVWNEVSKRLHSEGFATIAPAIPLRGLASDVEYLASFLDTIDGSVVLVGHSYGGSIISHPIIASNKVKGLIFIATFALNTGETTAELNERWPGSQLSEATDDSRLPRWT